MNTLMIHHHQQNQFAVIIHESHKSPCPTTTGFSHTKHRVDADCWDLKGFSFHRLATGDTASWPPSETSQVCLPFVFYSYGYCNCFAIKRGLPHRLIPVPKNNKLVVWRLAFPKHNLPPAFISRKIEHYGLHEQLRYSPPPICNISSLSTSSTSCHSALTLDSYLYPFGFFKKVQTLPFFSLKKKKTCD